MEKVIYTVLFGDYKLYEPEYITPGWKYICFSDRFIISKNWDVRILSFRGDPRKLSRFVKINCSSYVNADMSIYIDSKFKVKCNLDKFVEANYLDLDLTVMGHNRRSCAYDEAKFCIKLGTEKKEILEAQMSQYKKEGFPKQFGLYAPGIMIRNHTKEVKEFMKRWWCEVSAYSYRDIPSLSYCLWKYQYSIGTMPFKKTYRMFR